MRSFFRLFSAAMWTKFQLRRRKINVRTMPLVMLFNLPAKVEVNGSHAVFKKVIHEFRRAIVNNGREQKVIPVECDPEQRISEGVQ